MSNKYIKKGNSRLPRRVLPVAVVMLCPSVRLVVRRVPSSSSSVLVSVHSSVRLVVRPVVVVCSLSVRRPSRRCRLFSVRPIAVVRPLPDRPLFVPSVPSSVGRISKTYYTYIEASWAWSSPSPLLHIRLLSPPQNRADFTLWFKSVIGHRKS